MGTSQEEERKEKIAETKRELQRRSLDQIAIFNPLDIEFQTIYDGFTHIAPAKKESTFPRYIAEKWLKEFADYMINRDEDTEVRKENEKRKAVGHQPLSPEEKNDFVSANGLLTSNDDLRLKYIKIAYKGISREHGLDMPAGQTPQKLDKRPADVKILEALDKEMGTEFPDIPEEQEIEELKDEIFEEEGDEVVVQA